MDRGKFPTWCDGRRLAHHLRDVQQQTCRNSLRKSWVLAAEGHTRIESDLLEGKIGQSAGFAACGGIHGKDQCLLGPVVPVCGLMVQDVRLIDVLDPVFNRSSIIDGSLTKLLALGDHTRTCRAAPAVRPIAHLNELIRNAAKILILCHDEISLLRDPYGHTRRTGRRLQSSRLAGPATDPTDQTSLNRIESMREALQRKLNCSGAVIPPINLNIDK